MRSVSSAPMRPRLGSIPTKLPGASRPRPLRSPRRPNWPSQCRCRNEVCPPAPSCCSAWCWPSVPMSGGIICRVRASCRRKPAPRYRHVSRRWPSRPCRQAPHLRSVRLPRPHRQPPPPGQCNWSPSIRPLCLPFHPARAAAAPLPPPIAASADQPRIVLRASADAWVQVRDRSGPVLLNRILHAGDTWDVPAKANLLLTTGNAGGTDLRGGRRHQPIPRRQRRGSARPAARSGPDQGRQAGGGNHPDSHAAVHHPVALRPHNPHCKGCTSPRRSRRRATA